VRFEQPWWLLLLVVLVPLTFLGIGALRAMSGARRWGAVTIRLLLIGLLVGLLAGPHSVRVTKTLATIIVVDNSESVRRYYGAGGQARIKAFIAGASKQGSELGGARGPDDLLGLVVFDGRAWAAALPGRREVSEVSLEVARTGGTNLADAVRLAWSLVPATASGRVVILSDGNQTRGDILAELGRGGGSGGPVDVVPLVYRVENEVSVERLDAPPSAPAGSVVPLRVVLNSTGVARGFLRVLSGDEAVSLPGGVGPAATLVPVVLKAGKNVVRLDVALDERRVHRYRAIFEPETGVPVGTDNTGVNSDTGVTGDSGVIGAAGGPGEAGGAVGDTVDENNSAEAYVISPSSGTVLLAEGNSESGSPLAQTLTKAGLTVKVVPPQGLPGDLLGLEEYDCIILDNVPADALPPGTAAAMAAYVSDLGGGLIMIGGSEAFGAGGWRGSPVEPLLPVRLDLPDRLLSSEVAIVFVLDNSGSMWRPVMGSSRTQQEIANEAAAMAIRSLDRLDQIGVIAFNSDVEEIVQLAPNQNPAEAAERVRGIMSGGGTNAGPGIALAGQWLRNATAKTKHIVVLSDGRSQNSGGLPGQAQALSDAGIKVSTISVGDDADASTMAEMARRGGGKPFVVTNPRTLPQIFMKAVRIVRTPLIREEPFVPVVLPTGSPLTGGLPTLPVLRGLVLTQARTEPTIINAITTPRGEPVLAHWQAGLGRCAAFTSDSGAWSADWIKSPVYDQFWKQVVRGVARSASVAQGLSVTISPVEGEGGGGGSGAIRVRLSTTGSQVWGKDLSSKVTLYSPGEEEGISVDASMAPVAPGVFEAIIPLPEGGAGGGAGSYVAVVKPTAAGKPLPPLVAGTSVTDGAELRVLASDAATLSAIAARSGGKVLDIDAPQLAKLFSRDGVPPRERLLPMWPLLLWIAVWLGILDIANRRLAWDRWVSALFGGARATEEAPAEAAARVAALLAGATTREVKEREEEPAIALGEAEAQRLREQAKDRRRAVRLAANQSANVQAREEVSQSNPAQPPIVTKDGEATEEPREAGGLLAAKRRAADRFKEE